MRIYVSCLALGIALVAGAPAANAQYLVAQPYQAFIIQPSGTLMTQMPLVAVPAGRIQPVQTVQTIATVPVTRPVVRHRVVTRTTIHHVAAINSSRPLYDTAAPPVAPLPAPPPALNATLEFDLNAGSIVARQWTRHPLCSC